jgi:hypothetical protein
MFPNRKETSRFMLFADSVDNLVRQASLDPETDISDDNAYENLFNALSSIFDQAGLQAIQLPSARLPSRQKILSPRLHILCHEYFRVSRIISAIKWRTLPTLQSRCPWLMQYIIPFFHARIPNPYLHQLFSLYCDEALNFYKEIRSALAKLRFHEECQEISRQQLASEKGRINSALLGGSTKKLYLFKAFAGPPTALAVGGSIITDPAEIRHVSNTYFQSLCQHTPHPLQAKAWMNTPSISSICQRTAADPFQWPQLMTLDNARALIWKGKARPHPGNLRQWEKWMVKSLNDYSFQFVLKLWNYSIRFSSFPRCVNIRRFRLCTSAVMQ